MSEITEGPWVYDWTAHDCFIRGSEKWTIRNAAYDIVGYVTEEADAKFIVDSANLMRGLVYEGN